MPADSRTAQWHGGDYARHSGHHRAFDDWFLARHRPSGADVVVDLGCGSGEFSARLASMVPQGRVIGVDPDESMLSSAAHHAAPNLEFRPGSAEALDEVVAPSSVDAVVSRAMLHWLPLDRYLRCFEAVRTVLRPGGVLHSESAGAGNVAGIVALVDTVASEHGLPVLDAFPDPGQVLELLETAGFEMADDGVRTVAQRRAFTREELVGMLRTQAAVALNLRAPSWVADRLVDEVVAGVDRLRRHDGTFDQTFVRLEILARSPGRPLGDTDTAG
jgi:SAM-dependent methyltransferase